MLIRPRTLIFLLLIFAAFWLYNSSFHLEVYGSRKIVTDMNAADTTEHKRENYQDQKPVATEERVNLEPHKHSQTHDHDTEEETVPEIPPHQHSHDHAHEEEDVKDTAPPIVNPPPSAPKPEIPEVSEPQTPVKPPAKPPASVEGDKAEEYDEDIDMGNFELSIPKGNWAENSDNPFVLASDAKATLFFLNVSRDLPVVKTPTNKYIVNFHPDDSASEYKLDILSSNNRIQSVKLHFKKLQCSSCVCNALLSHTEVPLAKHFYLVGDDAGSPDLKGGILWTEHFVNLETGVLKRFWIVPHPDILSGPYGKAASEASFNGRLESTETERYIPIKIGRFDAVKGGYPISVEAYDTGRHKLILTLNWFYGMSDPDQLPRPLLVSSHMKWQYQQCDMQKSLIAGAPFMTNIKLNKELSSTTQKCTVGDSPGRWLQLPGQDGPTKIECDSKLCTGDLDSAFMHQDWNGAWRRTVFVPYKCIYHIYNRADLIKCSEEKDIRWIHVFGDSQAREIAAYLLTQDVTGDTWIEHRVDQWLYDHKIRLTFNYWEDVMKLSENQPRDFKFAHDEFEFYNLTHPERGRPDVLVFSPSLAYSAWKLKKADYETWIDKVAEYFAPLPDQQTTRPMKLLWYNGPYIHSQAHEGTDPLTVERHLHMSEYGWRKLQPLGFELVDAISISRVRPDHAWDGLHYLRTGTAQWTGHVGGMCVNAALNAIFGDCH